MESGQQVMQVTKIFLLQIDFDGRRLGTRGNQFGYIFQRSQRLIKSWSSVHANRNALDVNVSSIACSAHRSANANVTPTSSDAQYI